MTSRDVGTHTKAENSAPIRAERLVVEADGTVMEVCEETWRALNIAAGFEAVDDAEAISGIRGSRAPVEEDEGEEAWETLYDFGYLARIDRLYYEEEDRD